MPTVAGLMLFAPLAVATLFSDTVLAHGRKPVLYGTDANQGNLITIDKTGAGTVVGNIRFASVPALAIDPVTGVLYAGGGAGQPDVFTVDKSTGSATLLGNSGLGFAAFGGLGFVKIGGVGVLFAAVNLAGDGGTGSDHLAIINTATGAAAVIGPFGSCTGVTVPSTGVGSCTIEGMEGIAFDRRGHLWGTLSARGAAGTPGLYRINPATGAATFVAPIQDEVGVSPSGGIVGLEFCTVKGHEFLLGGTGREISGAGDGGRLVIIDKSTGRFSFVGHASATSGSGLGGSGLRCKDPVIRRDGQKMHDVLA